MLSPFQHTTRRVILAGVGALLGLYALNSLAQDVDAFPDIVAAPGTERTSAGTESLASVTLSPIGKVQAKLGRVIEGKVTRLSYSTLGDHPPGELGIYRHVAALVKRMGGHQLNSGFNPAQPGVLTTGEVVFALTEEDRAPLAILGVSNAYNYRLTVIEP